MDNQQLVCVLGHLFFSVAKLTLFVPGSAFLIWDHAAFIDLYFVISTTSVLLKLPY